MNEETERIEPRRHEAGHEENQKISSFSSPLHAFVVQFPSLLRHVGYLRNHPVILPESREVRTLYGTQCFRGLSSHGALAIPNSSPMLQAQFHSGHGV